MILGCQPQWCQTPAWHSGIAKVSAKNRAAGTAFVVAVNASSAYLVTSAHVVEGNANPLIAFERNPEKLYRATVRDVEGGDERGLALLIVGNPPQGLNVLPASASESALQAKVDVAGYPSGDFTIVDTTVASRKGRDIRLSRETGEGFSGGPVLQNGGVVGMIYGRQQGFGMALGLDSIQAYLKGHNVPWGGRAERPTVESGVKTVFRLLASGQVSAMKLDVDGEAIGLLRPGGALVGSMALGEHRVGATMQNGARLEAQLSVVRATVFDVEVARDSVGGFRLRLHPSPEAP